MKSIVVRGFKEDRLELLQFKSVPTVDQFKEQLSEKLHFGSTASTKIEVIYSGMDVLSIINTDDELARSIDSFFFSVPHFFYVEGETSKKVVSMVASANALRSQMIDQSTVALNAFETATRGFKVSTAKGKHEFPLALYFESDDLRQLCNMPDKFMTECLDGLIKSFREEFSADPYYIPEDGDLVWIDVETSCIGRLPFVEEYTVAYKLKLFVSLKVWKK